MLLLQKISWYTGVSYPVGKVAGAFSFPSPPSGARSWQWVELFVLSHMPIWRAQRQHNLCLFPDVSFVTWPHAPRSTRQLPQPPSWDYWEWSKLKRCPCVLPEGIWGSGGIRSLILNRGFALRTLYTHRRKPRSPWNRSMCGSRGRSGFFFLEEKSFTLAGNGRSIPR